MESFIKRVTELVSGVFLTWILMKVIHFYFNSMAICVHILLFILINLKKMVTKGSTHLSGLT